MIKQTISFSQFCDSFVGSYKDNFSYEGKRALFDYLEQLSDDIDEDIELDTVAICCDYKEYESLGKCLEDYDNIVDRADLENHTTVIDLENGGIIIQQF